jgi:MFS family permease
MSWKIALTVALLTGIIMACITAPVADHVTQKLKVSNMEGGRGYLVVFLILVGLVGGAVVGLIGTRLAGAMAWGQFWKAAGLSLVIGNVVLFAIAGMFLMGIPKVPRMDGHPLALEIEMFLPLDLAPAEPPSSSNLRMSLYAGSDDNRYVEIDPNNVHREGDLLVIRTEAGLNTVAHTRKLSLLVGDTASFTLDMPLQPAPHAEDLVWTERMPMRLSTITGSAYTYTSVMVRYRVVKVTASEVVSP